MADFSLFFFIKLNLALNLVKGSNLICCSQGFCELAVAVSLSEVYRIPAIGLFPQPVHPTYHQQQTSLLDMGNSRPLDISTLICTLGKSHRTLS